MTQDLAEFLNAQFPGWFERGYRIREWLDNSGNPNYRLLKGLICLLGGENNEMIFAPEVAVPLLNRLGIHTVDDLMAWSADPRGFMPGIMTALERPFPRFEWEKTMRTEFNKQALLQAVENGPFALQPDFTFDLRYFRDAYYKILPPGVNCLRDILSQSRVPTLQYFEDHRDCDDFCYMFHGEMAQAKRGHYSFGRCEFTCYGADDAVLYRHSVVVTVHEYNIPRSGGWLDMYLLDPQNGAIWNTPSATPIYHPQQHRIVLDFVRF